MQDEDRLEHDISRANRAELLMRNELLQEAWEYIESQCVRLWRETHVNDERTRERIWAMLKANQVHKEWFGKVIANGQLSKAELRMHQKAAA